MSQTNGKARLTIGLVLLTLVVSILTYVDIKRRHNNTTTLDEIAELASRQHEQLTELQNEGTAATRDVRELVDQNQKTLERIANALEALER